MRPIRRRTRRVPVGPWETEIQSSYHGEVKRRFHLADVTQLRRTWDTSIRGPLLSVGKGVKWELPSFVNDVVCIAVSTDQDVQRAMKKADRIMEEEGEKAGIIFDKKIIPNQVTVVIDSKGWYKTDQVRVGTHR